MTLLKLNVIKWFCLYLKFIKTYTIFYLEHFSFEKAKTLILKSENFQRVTKNVLILFSSCLLFN